MPRRRRSYRSYNYSDYGRERALEHIREAEELSKQLGGTDRDVKDYFFRMRPEDRRKILREYGVKYGESAEQYALAAIPKWQSGQTKMSGMVAARLFNLLPPRMPMVEKLKLVENLWRQLGPRSSKRLRIGVDADTEMIIEKVKEHIDSVVHHYQIPENLERRFNWLSMGDVDVKQKLLNYLQDMEIQIVVEGTKRQLPVLLNHMVLNRDITQKMSHIIEIGNHRLDLVVDKNTTGVTWEEPSRAFSGLSNDQTNWVSVVGWVAGIAVVLYLVFT